MRQIAIFVFFLLSVFKSFSNVHHYTIYLVNGSERQTIKVGRKHVPKKRGDIIVENDSRIWWENPKQNLTASYSADGHTYTFYASKYFESKSKWKEKYTYLKYLRTVTTGSRKGTLEDEIPLSELIVFAVENEIEIDEFDLPISNCQQYKLLYCDSDFNIIEIDPIRYEGHSIYFTLHQLASKGINLSDPSLHFCLTYNNRQIVNYLTIEILH